MITRRNPYGSRIIRRNESMKRNMLCRRCGYTFAGVVGDQCSNCASRDCEDMSKRATINPAYRVIE